MMRDASDSQNLTEFQSHICCVNELEFCKMDIASVAAPTPNTATSQFIQAGTREY